MRARNLKPSLFKNEHLAVADPLYTVIFEGLWCLSDREGRIEDRPAKIHFDINPGRAFETTERSLGWLENTGFIERYVVDGTRFIWVKNFTKHQNPHRDERDSKLPEPGASTVPAPCKHSVCTEVVRLIPSSLTPDSRLLNPDSLTNPSTVQAPKAKKPKKAAATPPVIPPEVDAQAFERWIRYRAERRKPVAAASYTALFKKIALLGDFEAQRSAVEHSIANGYQGVFAEHGGRGSLAPDQPKSKPQWVLDNEALGPEDDPDAASR